VVVGQVEVEQVGAHGDRAGFAVKPVIYEFRQGGQALIFPR
jgi:hypothetical protein